VADHTPTIMEAEEGNRLQSLRLLGETAKLVSDLDDLYQSLSTTCTKVPGQTSEVFQAFLAVVHLHGVCRRELTVSALTLFRGHQVDAVLHTRIAIDAIATVWRISSHHETALIWLNAAQTGESYKEYRTAFHSKKLFRPVGHLDHHPVIVELKGLYDTLSTVIHVSIYGVAGRTSISTQDDVLSIDLHFLDVTDGRTVITGLFLILDSHRRILNVLAHAFEKCGETVDPEWHKNFTTVLAGCGKSPIPA
jgi:hypothetical protein